MDNNLDCSVCVCVIDVNERREAKSSTKGDLKKQSRATSVLSGEIDVCVCVCVPPLKNRKTISNAHAVDGILFSIYCE